MVFRFSTFTDPASIVTSVRFQIDSILAVPSLLGVVHRASTQPSSLSADIDEDKDTLTHGEGFNAVNDLRSGHPLVDDTLIPETDRLSSPSPTQIRNQIPVRQRTRHTLLPSDPPSSVINHPDLDRDHYQHHQAALLTIQSRANSTDVGELSSPDSKHDVDGDGGNWEVSCLVAGLCARPPGRWFPRGGYYIFVAVWDEAAAAYTLPCSMHCGHWNSGVYP